SQSQAVIVGRADDLDLKIDLSRLMWRFRAPAFDETALEVPTMLVLSPHAAGAFVPEPDAVQPPGDTRVDLWHSRLESATPGGEGSEDGASRTVGAVWARSGAPLGFPLRFGEPDRAPPLPAGGPPYVSLDIRDRYDLVHLTSDFSKRWAEPDPVDVNRLLLSSL